MSPRKVLSRRALVRRVAALRREGRRIVFTNGCFDLLHPGHVRYLVRARRLGDALVVGVNSDRSVRRLGKGAGRPVQHEADRAEVLAALAAVDYVTIFDEDTPLELIRAVAPDVLVKGGDWPVERIVGADLVRSHGGRVRSLPFASGYSTTALVRRLGG
jgi:rfaE bifunctional protein nucleotidyltransferase chain/domain